MHAGSAGFDWEAAARAAGVARDGRFNAGAMSLTQQTALIWRRPDGTTVKLSGADLTRRVAELASAMAALGVRRGDRVAGLLSKRPESYALALATWRLGAVYVPLFSGFGVESVRLRLVDSGTTLLVVDAANRGVVPELPSIDGLVVLDVDGPGEGIDRALDDVLARAPRDAGVADTQAGDLATIMYTSGTTGAPKGCLIAHVGVVNLWPFVEHAFGVGSGDVLFSTADAGWSFGLYTTGLVPLSRGATRVIAAGNFDAKDLWTTIRESGAVHMASAPTGYRQLMLAGADLLGERPSALTGATSGGEPLTPKVVDWFREHLGFHVRDCYGLTELGMVIAQMTGAGAAAPVPGAMGTAVPGFDVQICDDEGQPLPDGELGRIGVRDDGWLLGRGYWGRDDEWAARLRNGWWLTEDLARRDDAGQFWYVARADDVIVTAGYNVSAVEIEQTLLEHPAVLDAGCVAVPDERKGHVIAAHVVTSEGTDPELLREETRTLVGERLGWHCAPRHVVMADALPRTPSGKLKRTELRRLL